MLYTLSNLIMHTQILSKHLQLPVHIHKLNLSTHLKIILHIYKSDYAHDWDAVTRLSTRICK